MQAVIISFDSLAANSLGCYGNEWIETPNWDRLAATGAVFDRHFVDTIGPLAGMAWANGRHALSPPSPIRPIGLGSLLKSSGVAAKMIAASTLQDWQRSIDFDDVRIIERRDGLDVKPDEVPFARVVQAGISVWNEPNFRATPRLLWLHAPGPGLPPEGFESLYFEDFEERGECIAELTDEALSQHPAVYAGAVSLLDHWLGELLTGIEADISAEPILVIVMAARGHLWQHIKPSKLNDSHVPPPLGDQLARTPLVLKVHGDDRFEDVICLRSDRLVQTCDLVPTLLDWFDLMPTTVDPQLIGQSWLRELTEATPARSSLWFGDGEHSDAVRTADWLCIQDNANESKGVSPSSQSRSRVSLFTKPEDIWDVNDIASQQPEIVSELLRQIPQRSYPVSTS